MDDVDIELPEAVGGVESGFAHRTISLVEQCREQIARGVIVFAQVIVGDLVRAEILFD